MQDNERTAERQTRCTRAVARGLLAGGIRGLAIAAVAGTALVAASSGDGKPTNFQGIIMLASMIGLVIAAAFPFLHAAGTYLVACPYCRTQTTAHIGKGFTCPACQRRSVRRGDHLAAID